MLRNYIKIAWRSLWKNKVFTLLNIIGLSVAFGVAILLSLASLFDLSYDKFHDHADSIYKVYTESQNSDGAEASTVHAMPFASALKNEIPGIEKISRYLDGSVMLFYKEKQLNMDVNWVDEDFFTMFTFPVVKGNQNQLISEGATVAITEKIAKNIFGSADPVGKTVDLLINEKKLPYTVSAVLQDIPENSSIEFDMVIGFENNPRYTTLKDRWDHQNHEVFMQLQEDIAVSTFEKSTRAFTDLHFKEQINNAKRDGVLPNSQGHYQQLHLLAFKDSYFVSYHQGKAVISKALPYILLGIAALLLFISCVNFINMSIAKSTIRLQEIGVRKTLGAAKKQVFFQFWIESIMVFVITVIFGIVLSMLLLDPFRTLFNTSASFDNTVSLESIIGIILLFGVVTLAAGGYPAMLLSKLGTLQALKGKVQHNGGNNVRDVLMIIQFAIVILLISGTFVLHGQLQYMQDKDLGFNKERVISLPLIGEKESYKVVQLLREALKKEPNIISVTASDNNLGLGKDGSQSTSGFNFDYKDRSVGTHMLVVDYDYLETLDISLLSGRSFDRSFSTDSLSAVINEAMARELQEKDPLGKQMQVQDDYPKHTIIGVIKDYHFQKLNRAIEPLTLFLLPEKRLDYAYIKIAPDDIAETFAIVKRAWKNLEPTTAFLGSFLDENIDRTFKREKKMSTIISSGAIIAILLSCIGLLAISIVLVNMRTKEIGVRKVIGASIVSLLILLAKDFVKLVIVAFVIVVPVAWWYSSKWLEAYSYRMELSVWFFAAAGLIAFGIALVTIGFGTVRAALQNPVKSLRTE